MLIIRIVLSSLVWTIIHGTTTQISPNFLRIGALFSVRGSPDPSGSSLKCGKIREVHGIQKIEAALLAIDQINNDPHLLPGIELGLEVRDTCWSETLALRQSLCLIRGSSLINVPRNPKRLDGEQKRGFSQRKMIIKNPSVVGVIGPATAEQSIQVQNLLKLLNIPQIGYSDTMEELDDRSKYPTFLRGAPCDSLQTTVLRDILIKFNWRYVAVVYTSGAFGGNILKSFKNLIEPPHNSSKICIATNEVIEPNSTEADFDAMMLKLNRYESVNVIIGFCEREVLRELFRAAKRLNLSSRFTFIVSDGWGDPNTLVHDVEEQAWGTIAIVIHTPKIPEFTNYYTSLKPATNTRNLWFREFWEDKFECSLPVKDGHRMTKDSDDMSKTNDKTVPRKPCTGNESLAENYFEHRKVYFVMSAITTMSKGLHNMIAETCGSNYTGLCPKMQNIDTSKLVDHLIDISFTLNNTISFEHGKPSARYDILNFQKLPNNTFRWVNIGGWFNGNLNLHTEFQNRVDRNSTSICALPCASGYYKSFARNNVNQNCCWNCKPCGIYEYVSPNQEQCIECPRGEKPNAKRTECEKIPIEGIRWGQPTVIMVMTFTISGIVGTIFTFYIFIKYKNTPILRASNSQISYFILVSMLLAHVSVFTILAIPTTFLCVLSRTLPGVFMTMMYAGLFTETYKIARIAALSKQKCSTKKPRLITFSSQMAITFFCVAVETAVCFAMVLASPSSPIIVYPIRDQPIITCSITATDLIPPFIPILFLHGLCIVYTIKTRNIPGNFNEAKFMGFAMLISCVAWIIFVTVFFGTAFEMMTMSLCLTLFPSFILVFLFFPKVYIILFRPEKNHIGLLETNRSRKAVMTSQSDTNTGTMFDSSENTPYGNNPLASKHSAKLRRNVAVQTSMKLLRKTISLPDDDSRLLADVTNSDFGNNADRFSKFGDNILAAVSTSLEKNTHSYKNEFTSRDEIPRKATKSLGLKFDSLRYEATKDFHNKRFMTLPSESCLELNVKNLSRLDNDRAGVLRELKVPMNGRAHNEVTVKWANSLLHNKITNKHRELLWKHHEVP